MIVRMVVWSFSTISSIAIGVVGVGVGIGIVIAGVGVVGVDGIAGPIFPIEDEWRFHNIIIISR